MNKDVIVVCSNCGKTKLSWEVICTNCKKVDKFSLTNKKVKYCINFKFNYNTK